MSLIEDIKTKMREKSTTELLNIREQNNREEWSDLAFEAIDVVLSERNVVPLTPKPEPSAVPPKPLRTPSWPGLAAFFAAQFALFSLGMDSPHDGNIRFLVAVGVGLFVQLLAAGVVGSINRSRCMKEERSKSIATVNSTSPINTIVSVSLGSGIIAGLIASYAHGTLGSTGLVLLGFVTVVVKGRLQKLLAALLFGLFAGLTCALTKIILLKF